MTKHPLGSGPVIARGTALHPRVTDLLYRHRRGGGDPVHDRVAGPRDRHRRRCVHASRTGVPTAIVSVPLRYMHSPVETGLTRRHRGGRRADRGLRQAAGARHVVRAVARWRSPALIRGRACCCCSTSTGRSLAAPDRAREALHAGAARGPRHRHPAPPRAGLGRRAHRRRDRPAAAARRRGLGRADRRAAPDGAGRLRRAYARLCPPDLSDTVIPGIAELLDVAGRRATACGSSLVTGNYEPVARLKLKRAGIGHHFAARPGRLRLGLRGPRRAAAASPASAPATTGSRIRARADDRDRRHPARHRLRAGRRRALLRGGDRPVRARSS